MMPMKMSEKNRLRTLSYSVFAIITSRAVTQKKGNVAGAERRGTAGFDTDAGHSKIHRLHRSRSQGNLKFSHFSSKLYFDTDQRNLQTCVMHVRVVVLLPKSVVFSAFPLPTPS